MRYYVLFLTLVCSFFPAKAFVSTVHKHHCFEKKNPLCKAIIHLQPKLDLDYALQLSDIFYTVAKNYKLPAPLLVSIAMQESRFNLSALRKVSGLELNSQGKYVTTSIYTDFCLMQINTKNIKRLELDAQRLLTDAPYCIEAGARILTESKSWQKIESDKTAWWSRYNGSNALYRKVYQEQVLAHWRKLDPLIESDLNIAASANVKY